MKLRILALVLVAALLLAGCARTDFRGEYQSPEDTAADSGGEDFIRYADMTYTRPDMDRIRQSLNDACTVAQAGDARATMKAVFAFYDEYDWFYTCYSLADIRYSGDLTDAQWEEEYNYCVENSAAVDAMLEELYYSLAQSPSREALESDKYFGRGFFDAYDGDNLWDETFTALLERENTLENRYYALATQALAYESGTEEYYDACADDMAGLLAELIGVRQEMARYWGYDDYPQFAYDFYYYRDYTPEQVEAYLEAIRRELVPIYRKLDDSVWDWANRYCSETETFAFVRQAAQNMGGAIWEAFRLMEEAGLSDIAYGENKYNSSFEVYLTSYQEPFLFMNPELTRYDCLTLAHEFGHFCNDYACYGSYAGVDVLEFFSQSMEYLLLCYGDKTEQLTRVKLADSLCTYVEQAGFASFEQRMYSLTGEDLSAEGLYALYEEVALAFGFDSVGYDPREFVEITHFYTNPMYVVSYVVSNDAAMQLYQLEQAEAGAGLALMEENLSAEYDYFLDFLEAAGLESPFGAERLAQVRRTFEDALR